MRAQLLPVRFAVAVVLLFAGQLVLGQMLPAVTPAQVPPDVAHLAEAWLTPAEHGRLEHAGVRLDVPAGALLAPVRLTLAALDEAAMPRLDPGLDNLTAPFPCLRLGPDGFKSQTAMTLTLPYDPARLPAGAVPEDVHTWFFDEQAE
ncbi:MAG TPA: hypothetical protein VKU40_15445, partial [Thermoanaerobaculia bacterium]|nr:hypothetical protein [Thermoanaerobaculia bacterium]